MRKRLFKRDLHDAMRKKNIIDQLYKCNINRIDGKYLEDCEYKDLVQVLAKERMKVEV